MSISYPEQQPVLEQVLELEPLVYPMWFLVYFD
jgi:hypothetical protein